MSKVRVYELARQLGIESKELVDFLVDLGADVKNHMSTIEGDIAELVVAHFRSEANGQSERSAASAAEQPAQDKGQSGKADGQKNPLHDGKTTKTQGAQMTERTKTNQRTSATSGRSAPQAEATRPRTAQAQKSGDSNQKGQRSGRPAAKGKAQATKSRGTLVLPDSITVKEFADKLGVPATAMIKTLMQAGVMAGMNQSIDFDAAATVAQKLGFEVERPKSNQAYLVDDGEDSPDELEERPPIVTIMGHVDHGKTTLLDAIRKSQVAESEAGGITQHIGAYQVKHDGKLISFVDTPGHEAFTAMRSRGAQVTDIAVLVVAADDGVMPQTREALNHAKAADVPIIVAVNKMDRPGANPDRVKQQLSEEGLIPEDWGGDTVFVQLSALQGEGIDDLLEMILLVAELRELKANPHRRAVGTVIESELDKGRGPVATILVRNGTLKIGDSVVAGAIAGKVRALFNDMGEPIKEAGPSTPVEVLGLSDVPQAGDLFEAVEDDRAAREIALQRQSETRSEVQRTNRVRLAELFSQVEEGEVKDLNIVVKADVQGSAEALRESLEKLTTEQVRVNVIHAAAGGITESDVNLAAASNAIIIGFNVRPESTARHLSEREGVDIQLYRVIYEALQDVEQAMEGMLEPTYEEAFLGRAEVRATFKVPGAGTVAGCYIQEGKIHRNAQVRVLRDNVVVFEGALSSLRRFKDDVREVSEGYECGIGIERFNDVKEGDVIEAYEMREV